jgi:hypothetical protein
MAKPFLVHPQYIVPELLLNVQPRGGGFCKGINVDAYEF